MEGALSPVLHEPRNVTMSLGWYSAPRRDARSPPTSSYSSARAAALTSTVSASGRDTSAKAPAASRPPV